MTLLDATHRIAISEINIDRESRHRRELKVGDLVESLGRVGQLQPIVVEQRLDGSIWLKAGERRLTAARELGWPDILVRFTSELSATESQIIELEENLRRSDLIWQDQVRAVAQIHQLFCSDDPLWTAERTGRAIGFTPGTMSVYMAVSRWMADEKVATASSIREAYNMTQRRESRQADEKLQELLDITLPGAPDATAPLPLDVNLNQLELQLPSFSPRPAPVPSSGPSPTAKLTLTDEPPAETPKPAPISPAILNTSFLDWVESYEGQKFNLIHCDFPYGIGVFSGEMGGKNHEDQYDDSEDTYWALLERFLVLRNRFMSSSAHVVFWYSAKHLTRTLEMFETLAPELVIRRHPLIWWKTCNTGVLADPKREPRHVYETALLISRGDRLLVQAVADCYGAPTDKALHPSCKPEPMLKHFFRMLVDETTVALDPTAGSGSAIRAAAALGAKGVLGLERDAEYCRRANEAFGQAQAKALAASKVLP